MPTPPEGVPEQIVAALATSLAGISAVAEPTVFWYTPSQVLRVEDLDPKYLRKQDDVVYQILEGDELPVEDTSGGINGDLEVWLLAAKLWKPVPFDAFSPYTAYSAGNPSPQTIRNRLIKDVKTKIYRDVYTSTGVAGIVVAGVSLCEGAEVKTVNKSLRMEQGSMWVAVEMHIVLRFTNRFDAP